MKANDTRDDAKFQVMRKIIVLKFDQNNNIRDKLLSTTGYLYEATKDTDFGCGLTLGQNKEIKQDNLKRGKICWVKSSGNTEMTTWVLITKNNNQYSAQK